MRVRTATIRKIARAAKMEAAGKAMETIAMALGMRQSNLDRLRKRHFDLWVRCSNGDPPPIPPAGKHVPIIQSETATKIARAAKMEAAGAGVGDIAAAMGVTPGSVRYWKRTYHGLWAKCVAHESERVIAAVRAAAGTDAVVDDPDGYLRMARAADKWARMQGEDLFPIGEDVTLGSFYRDAYLPLRGNGLNALTRQQYDIAVRLWRAFTGDPPLREITPIVLGRFRTCLERKKGRGVCRLSTTTIRNKLQEIQTILTLAGPPGPRHRDSMGLIPSVPWIRPPRRELKIPRVIPLDVLENLYLATASMDRPNSDGIKPPRWWKTLLVVAYNTGLRKGTLLALRMADVDWARQLLVIPGERMKTRRPLVVPLNAPAMTHLRTMRTDRELVFPWSINRAAFWDHWKHLQNYAGIPAGERYGFHDLRRTHATTLCGFSLTAAQLSLGHESSAITQAHYVNPNQVVAAALAQLPQPAAFKAAGESAA